MPFKSAFYVPMTAGTTGPHVPTSQVYTSLAFYLYYLSLYKKKALLGAQKQEGLREALFVKYHVKRSKTRVYKYRK
jgi:hypothetical protein